MGFCWQWITILRSTTKLHMPSSFTDLDKKKDFEYAIEYFAKKGETAPAVKEYGPIEVHHSFPYDAEKFECEYAVMASDTSVESGYPLDHPKNAGASREDDIGVDLTWLRTQGLIQPVANDKGEKY